jgi:hypothetical protein
VERTKAADPTDQEASPKAVCTSDITFGTVRGELDNIDTVGKDQTLSMGYTQILELRV